jgi:hypothetical protein
VAKEHGAYAGFGFGIAFLRRGHEIPPGGVVVLTVEGGDGGIGFGGEGGIEAGGLRRECRRGCRGSLLLWLRLWLRRLFPSPGERLAGCIGADDCVVIDEAIGP